MSTNSLLILSLGLLATAPLRAQTPNAAPYCKPVFGGSATSSGITAVQIGLGSGTVNNTAAQNNTYTFYNGAAYSQTTLTGVSNGGFCYRVSATGDASTPRELHLLVDWNQDNAFDISKGSGVPGSEWAYSTYNNFGSYNLTSLCAIPDDTAVNGTTRVRIMWTVNAGPCTSTTSTPHNGEVEDYTVTISGAKSIPRVGTATNLSGTKATLRGTVQPTGALRPLILSTGRQPPIPTALPVGALPPAHTRRYRPISSTCCRARFTTTALRAPIQTASTTAPIKPL